MILAELTNTFIHNYDIKTSRLLSGRDGDTMMSSESSDSSAASASNSAEEWSSLWAATDRKHRTMLTQPTLIINHP